MDIKTKARMHMQKRKLGKNLEVSAIGMGCMTVGRSYSSDDIKEATAILRKAYELGITMKLCINY